MVKKIAILLSILFLIFFKIGSAQTDFQFKIDSLKLKLNEHPKSDTTRLGILFNIGYNYILEGKFLDSSLVYSDKVNGLAKKLKNSSYQAKSFSLKANAYTQLAKYDLAEKNFKDALLLYLKGKDTIGICKSYSGLGLLDMYKGNYDKALGKFKKSLALAEKSKADDTAFLSLFQYLGIVNLYQGNYTNSLEYFHKTLKYTKENDYYSLANTYLNISAIYIYQDNYLKAEGILKKVIKLKEKVNDELGIGVSLQNLGIVNMNLNKKKDARRNFEKAKIILEKYGEKRNLANCYNNLGLLDLEENRFDSSLENYQKGLKIFEEIGDEENVYLSKIGIGRFYVETNEAKKGKQWINKALATTNPSLKENAYRALSSADSAMGNYKSAFENYKKSILYKDSIFNQENTEKLISLDLNYKFSQKEDSIRMENEKELAIKDAKIESNYKEKWIYAISTIGLALILGLLLYQSKQNKILNLKQLELKQKEADNLVELDKTKSKFLSNITHEFRTPLTLIKGNAALLKANISNIEDQNRLYAIEENSQKLLNLINQMLELTKLESGSLKLKYKKNTIWRDLYRSFHMFDSLAAQKQIRFEMELDSKTQSILQNYEFVYSQDALVTILTNLLSNAFKFTPDYGKIEVEIAINEQELKFLEIKVSDSGIGVSSKDLDKLFDRFYQIDDSHIKKYDGTGIGLSLVKELVELHGGTVNVESIKERGTSFTVLLSLENCESYVGNEIENLEIFKTPKELFSTISQQNIDEELPLLLLVEDNFGIQNFIVDALKNKFQIRVAENGKSGIEQALKIVPDLIVCDIMMPEVDGLELTQKLKNNAITSHIPIVLLTAKSDEEAKLEGLKLGADEYLTKPFSLDELDVRIENLIKTRKLLQEKFKSSLLLKVDETELMSKDKKFLDRVISVIRQNLNEGGFGVDELATEIGLSSSQLNRKIKAITGDSTVKFIRLIRLQKAFEMLKADSDNIASIAYSAGFESPGYFTKVFKAHFGYLPSDKERLNNSIQKRSIT